MLLRGSSLPRILTQRQSLRGCQRRFDHPPHSAGRSGSLAAGRSRHDQHCTAAPILWRRTNLRRLRVKSSPAKGCDTTGKLPQATESCRRRGRSKSNSSSNARRRTSAEAVPVSMATRCHSSVASNEQASKSTPGSSKLLCPGCRAWSAPYAEWLQGLQTSRAQDPSRLVRGRAMRVGGFPQVASEYRWMRISDTMTSLLSMRLRQ
jgi:hypothetical protein